jgi:lipopolysaccharide export LptBFGC system permease protein LptF
MRSLGIDRKSLTCIVVIFAFALLLLIFFAIPSLASNVQNKILASSNGVATEAIKTPATPLSAIFNPDSNASFCRSWKIVRSDISGNRSDIWNLIYEHDPNTKISWFQFKDQVVLCNPTLKKDGYIFIEGKTYILP